VISREELLSRLEDAPEDLIEEVLPIAKAELADATTHGMRLEQKATVLASASVLGVALTAADKLALSIWSLIPVVLGIIATVAASVPLFVRPNFPVVNEDVVVPPNWDNKAKYLALVVADTWSRVQLHQKRNDEKAKWVNKAQWIWAAFLVSLIAT